jgi:cysteinyl-tRNA synthetase
MALFLFNSDGRKLEEFTPMNPEMTGFYGCGPTVYNYAHIGNLRAYVTHDILLRSLKRLGYPVKYVMNITDVGHLTGDDDSGDDKMVKSAAERGKSVLEIAQFYTDAFFTDTQRLNISKPDVVCKATEHIGDMIALAKRLEEKGFTYMAGGNLYFDISKFKDYGKMAGLRLDEQKAGARVKLDENKRNPQDFALWFTKSKFENQALLWDSPWGKGYPGWHIECSAMSMKYLGESFDIHAGGIDHIPVHHTNEIAQSEAATGKQWVRYWLHNEFLVLDKAKMSKSSGSFLTLQSLIDAGYEPLDYRYFLLSGHYRSQLQFSFPALDGARSSRKSLIEKVRQLAEKVGGKLPNTGAPQFAQNSPAAELQAAFNTALEQDLSTPRALAEVWSAVKDPQLSPAEALALVFDMDEVLALGLREAAEAGKTTTLSPELEAETGALIQERTEAKKNKDFARADAIRDLLKTRGIILEDSPSGTTWKLQ